MALATYKITNILPQDESAYPSGAWAVGGDGVPLFIKDKDDKYVINPDAVNPGAKTGPYGDGKRNNTLYIPIPRTNFQIKLGAGDFVEVVANDTLEVEFFKALEGTLKGAVTVETVEAEETEEEPVDDQNNG